MVVAVVAAEAQLEHDVAVAADGNYLFLNHFGKCGDNCREKLSL